MEFLLTSQHRWLYTGFARSGLRGYSNNEANESRFLATLVLAMFQTKMEGDAEMHRVALVIPGNLNRWYAEQVKRIAHHIFAKRKGEPAACRILKASFEHLLKTHQVLQIRQPDRWAIFGFTSHDPLPPWVQGHLL